MKNSFKRLLGLIALFTLLFMFSCTEEFDVKNENEHQKNRNFEIKYKSFQQLMKEQKFNSAYTKVGQKIKTVKLTSKTVMEEMYNFTIDTTVINEYHTNNYTSYNIGIIRDSLSNNYFENLFVEIDSSNVTTARILKYTINPISKLISSVETTPIIYNATSVTGKEAPGGEDCQTVSVYLQTQCGCPGHHWPGEGGCNCPSDPSTSTLLYSFTSCPSGGGGDVFDTGTLPSDPGTSILVTTTGGGSGSGSIAVPVVINYEKLRKNNLFKGTFFSLSERTWFFSQSEETQGAIMNYLESTLEDENGFILANVSEYSLEAKTFVKQLIDYSFQYNNSPDSIEEIKNILDILDDGMVDGEEVLVGPDIPITNMEDYLDCFNTSQGATITIYADQPKNNEHDIWSMSDGVGHAFISIKQGNKVASFGFYPISTIGSAIPNNLTPDPTDFFSTPGVFGNDQGHDYDVSLSVPINSVGLTNLINGIVSIANDNPMYNIASVNCTDVAILFFESQTDVDIPNCESPRPWNGQTPGTLGEVIRNMPIPSNGTKNTNGGNAPNNNCN